jgi:hypothetical protein
MGMPAGSCADAAHPAACALFAAHHVRRWSATLQTNADVFIEVFLQFHYGAFFFQINDLRHFDQNLHNLARRMP